MDSKSGFTLLPEDEQCHGFGHKHGYNIKRSVVPVSPAVPLLLSSAVLAQHINRMACKQSTVIAEVSLIYGQSIVVKFALSTSSCAYTSTDHAEVCRV